MFYRVALTVSFAYLWKKFESVWANELLVAVLFNLFVPTWQSSISAFHV